MKKIKIFAIVFLFFGCARNESMENLFYDELYTNSSLSNLVLETESEDSSLKGKREIQYFIENTKVYLKWGNGERAVVYYHPEKYRIEINKITGVKFSVIVDNDNNELIYSDDYGEVRSFSANENGWFNKESGEPVSNDWYRSTKINHEELLLIPQIMAQLESQMLISFSFSLRRQAELREELTEYIRMNKSNMVTPMLAHPCDNKCRGNTVYHWVRSLGCADATADVNSRCCSSNGYCIGCCDVFDCDCFTVVGDYLVACTTRGNGCSGPPMPTL